MARAFFVLKPLLHVVVRKISRVTLNCTLGVETLGKITSRKKGFHSLPLVPNVFGPWLKGSLVSVHLKMWAREH
jgi:hypothetical protein